MQAENNKKETKQTEKKKETLGDEKVLDVEELSKNNKRLEEQILLLLAKSQNDQRSFQEQLQKTYKFGAKKTLKWVLDFYNDLKNKALPAMQNDKSTDVKKHIVGIEMLCENVWRNLQNEGIKKIEIKKGEDVWDSRLHDFVAEEEDDNLPTRTVIDIIEEGFLIHDQVLKPAKVKISKKKQ